MKSEEIILLNNLIETGAYESIWRNIFYESGSKWIKHTNKIIVERFNEHKDEQCEAFNINEDELKFVYRTVLNDAEERYSYVRLYTKYDNTIKRRREIDEFKMRNMGHINEQQKSVLDYFGCYEKAINSCSVQKWLSYDSGITENAIFEYYKSHQ